MKKISFILLLALLTACSVAKWPSKKYIARNNYQEVMGHLDSTENKKAPDNFAMYPEGIKGINKLIIKNVKYPRKAIEKGITGKVLIKYVVETDGYVGEIKVVKSVNPVLDNEAIRVINLMDRWIPGYTDGKPVRVAYMQPFYFNLK